MKKNIADIVWHDGHVTSQDRQIFLGQQPLTIWLTGLSASGKSTLAFSLERELLKVGLASYVLDGDNIRHGLSSDLGFSDKDRNENIRRIAEVAKLMNDAGLIVITAFISPYCSDRNKAREIIGEDKFKEIYVNTPLSVCESRDPKGMYNRARKGLLPEFTGITAPYEPPLSPDLSIDTSENSLEECLSQLVAITMTQTNRASDSAHLEQNPNS